MVVGCCFVQVTVCEVLDVCVLGLAHCWGWVGRVVVVWFVMAVGCLGQSVVPLCVDAC